MKEILIVSNSCVGVNVVHKLYPNREYTTPFIGTLIPNDQEYLRLCNNIIYYMNLEPIISTEKKN
jgi:uncharacterized protein (DUF1919 family)